MARPLRIHVPGARYHVMSRGNGRQRIFLNQRDYRLFMKLLDESLTRFSVRCLSYCLMKTHYHLVLQPAAHPISRMMQQLNSSYARLFNKNHGGVGHVYQGRFKSLVVDTDQYFFRVLRYVALNPVASGAASRPDAWRWSSHRALAGIEPPPEFLAVEDVWREFDPTDPTNAQRQFIALVARTEADLELPDGLLFGSETFERRVEPLLRPHRTDRELPYADRFAVRPTLGVMFANLPDRNAVNRRMLEAFVAHAYTLKEIGDFVGQHPSTVWRRMRQDHRPDTEGPWWADAIKNQDLTPPRRGRRGAPSPAEPARDQESRSDPGSSHRAQESRSDPGSPGGA